METERKFLLNKFPNLFPIEKGIIYQGYLKSDAHSEIRIRETFLESIKYSTYKLCRKSIGDLSRSEIQIGLPKFVYAILKYFIKKPMIKKEYKKYCLTHGLEAECSLVDDKWMYVEVEFKTETEANLFVPPKWFGPEVTYNPDYKMKNYWNNSRKHL